MTKNTSYKILNAWQLKLVMVFLMTLNHLEYIYQFIQGDLRSIFIIISRCVAPVFAYLAIEGVLHTQNLKNYCIRLLIWSFIVTTGNILLEFILKGFASGIALGDQVFLVVRTNITITLAAGVFCIALIKWGQANEGVTHILLYGGSLVCFIIGFIFEWGIVLLPFMLVTYFFQERGTKKYMGYAIVEGIAILFRSEIFYFLAFPFIALYNGKRGPNGKFNKYFFYVFYPVHLWVIAIINFFILSR